ncbi:uncharacterized protein G2W53_039918 [Senna tora]|uniref:Uncharacterized protein n=1 Tax=Senna tora TaxID=362788 RepID=A0A834W364_9FABA|nr:uncharacterized protein G2W53_039918 [Senna tora]
MEMRNLTNELLEAWLVCDELSAWLTCEQL